MSDILTEVEAFRTWAAKTYPSGPSGGEWECNYERWDRLHAAVFELFGRLPFESWSPEEIRAVLYTVARDNEIQHVAREISACYPDLLLPLTRATLELGEPDARWQLAEELGKAGRAGGVEEELLLLVLVRDEDEYVRRKALQALTRLGSAEAEMLALEIWDRPDPNQEWARMMVLWCLHGIGSPHLERLLEEAERDPRPYLSGYVQKIRADDVGQP